MSVSYFTFIFTHPFTILPLHDLNRFEATVFQILVQYILFLKQIIKLDVLLKISKDYLFPNSGALDTIS